MIKKILIKNTKLSRALMLLLMTTASKIFTNNAKNNNKPDIILGVRKAKGQLNSAMTKTIIKGFFFNQRENNFLKKICKNVIKISKKKNRANVSD